MILLLLLIVAFYVGLPVLAQFSVTDTIRAFRFVGRYGYIDRDGHWAIHPQFSHASSFSDNLAAVADEHEKWGFIDKAGRFKIKPSYDNALPFTQKLAAVCSQSKWGFINNSGRYIIQPAFDAAMSFSEGLAAIKIGTKWGFINRAGKVIVEPLYEECQSFSDGYAAVKIGSRWGFIDRSGKTRIEPKFSKVNSFAEGICSVDTDIPSSAGSSYSGRAFINKSGVTVLAAFLPFSDPSGQRLYSTASSGLLPVIINHSGLGFVNHSTARVVCSSKDWHDAQVFSEGRAAVQCTSKKHFFRSENELDQWMASSSGHYYQEKEGFVAEEYLWGFIDVRGNLLIHPEFTSVSPFREGLAKVVLPSRMEGFIDKAGRIAIIPTFQVTDSFSGGLALAAHGIWKEIKTTTTK